MIKFESHPNLIIFSLLPLLPLFPPCRVTEFLCFGLSISQGDVLGPFAQLLNTQKLRYKRMWNGGGTKGKERIRKKHGSNMFYHVLPGS